MNMKMCAGGAFDPEVRARLQFDFATASALGGPDVAM
jgi:hypothetical protein